MKQFFLGLATAGLLVGVIALSRTGAAPDKDRAADPAS